MPLALIAVLLLLLPPPHLYVYRSYYVPLPGEDMSKADARVPLLQQLLTAQGTSSSQAVQGVVWSGVTFAYAGWLQPSEGLGYASQQSGAHKS